MQILTLIVNFFASSIEKEQANQKKWAEWLYSAETTKEFKKRKLLVKEHLIFRGKRENDITTGKEIVYVDMSTKGKILRLKLDKIKEAGISSEHYSDYIVYIDGDGDIDFNIIQKVLDVLINKHEICFVCRKGKYMMGKNRDSIERFENYLLENRYGVSLPDGQCGCWGFRKKTLGEGRILTADGFDIELDILSMCLERSITPYFIPTVLNISEPSQSSTFKPYEHRIKLNFIISKLGFPTNFLAAFYKNFQIEYPSLKLPQEYLTLLEEITGSPIIRKLPACDEKGTCERCDIVK